MVIYEAFSSKNGLSKLTIISDRLATHRVYYHYDEGIFCWASNLSELLELTKLTGKSLSLDYSNLSGYLRFLHQPASKTLLKGASTLPPASRLTLSKDGVGVSTYWSPEFSPTVESAREAVDEIQHLFDEVISPQICTPNEKTGLFLSGGLDSSIIASLAQKGKRELFTYTVGFEGVEDERSDARTAAQYFGTKHKELIIKPEDIHDLLWQVTRSLGLPSGNPSSLATYVVAKQAKEDVDRLLSGLGCDELFGGHTKHIFARYWFISSSLIFLVRKLLSLKARAQNVLMAEPSKISNYLDFYTFFDRDQLEELFLPPTITASDSFYAHLRRDNFFEEQFLVDVYAWLADDLLPLAMTLISKEGLHLDLPFCTDEALELAARIPLKLKVKGSKGKWVLRKASPDLVPGWVFKRKRRGFTLPIAQWLKGPLRSLLDTYLSTSVVGDRGIFKADMVREMVRAHTDGKADLSLPLWGLITLEVWQRIFLDNQANVNGKAT